MKYKVYGYSDDIIYIECENWEEEYEAISLYDKEAFLIEFRSSASIIAHYNSKGLWKITPKSWINSNITLLYDAKDPSSREYSDILEIDTPMVYKPNEITIQKCRITV